MVYCTKCGTKNEDDAKVCSSCGASLVTTFETRRHERRVEEECCFGLPRGGSIFGMIVGLIILLVGISMILSAYGIFKLEVGPIVVIIIGILLIVGAYYGMRRRY